MIPELTPASSISSRKEDGAGRDFFPTEMIPRRLSYVVAKLGTGRENQQWRIWKF
jgi:hypothetical protein